MNLFYKEIHSPVGKLKLIASDRALVAILWDKEKPSRVQLDKPEQSDTNPILLEAETQLNEYFKGARKTFDLPLQASGTAFQTQVWNALKKIPFGQTKSYGEIAREIGLPKASRAVGAANGRNPLSIIVPCHRVIGQNGKLTGFAGGLSKKEILLKLEGFE